MLLSEKYLKSNRKPYSEFMDILESFRLEMFNDPKVVVGEQINRLEILDDRFLKISNKIRAEFLNYYEDMAIFPNELSRKSNQELFLESLK